MAGYFLCVSTLWNDFLNRFFAVTTLFIAQILASVFLGLTIHGTGFHAGLLVHFINVGVAFSRADMVTWQASTTVFVTPSICNFAKVTLRGNIGDSSMAAALKWERGSNQVPILEVVHNGAPQLRTCCE